MRGILYFFILLPSCFISQNRNQHVVVLNEVVELMNRASRLNRQYYDRAAEFCGNLCNKYPPAEWVSVVVEKKPLLSYVDRNDSATIQLLLHKKPGNLHPDKNGQIYTYEGDAIPYILQKEKLTAILTDQSAMMSPVVATSYMKFSGIVDELISLHYEMRSYTHTKQQFKDKDFKTAKLIAGKFHYILEKYRNSLNALWDCIEKDYKQNYPPFNTQLPILNAEKELLGSLKLVYTWADDKFNNINTKDSFHIHAILSNVNKALALDSVYFINTYGYGPDISPGRYFSASLETPGRLYNYFYNTTLTSIARANIASTNLDFNKSDPSKRAYNYKVIHFNTAINAYNRFITWADGKTISGIAKSNRSNHILRDGIDSSENVILKRPYLVSYFNCLCVSENQTAITLKTDNTDQLSATDTIANGIVTGSKSYDSLVINKALPHHLVYLLDASSSMNESDRLEVLKSNAKYLVNLQRKTDRISIVSFASLAHVIMHNTSCDQKTEIHQKIDRISAQGSSNIDAGILKAFEIADSCKIRDGKTKLLLITDGLFRLSKQSLKLIKSLDRHEIDFCIIYIGNSQNAHLEEQFKKISDLAKGRFYNTKTNNLRTVLVKEASE